MKTTATLDELYALKMRRQARLIERMQAERTELAKALESTTASPALRLDLNRAITERYDPRFNELDTFERVLISMLQELAE